MGTEESVVNVGYLHFSLGCKVGDLLLHMPFAGSHAKLLAVPHKSMRRGRWAHRPP
jgi:hypothetical protein